MKKTFFLGLLFFSTIIIYGQSKSNERRKTTIDKESVSYAKIGNFKKAKLVIDSIYGIEYRNLSTEQTNHFIDQWNNATYKGEKKIKPKYSIHLYLKNGTIIYIEINNTLCEKRLYQFTINDKDFINKLWDNTK